MDMMASEYMQEWIDCILTPRILDTAFSTATPQNLSIGPGLVKLIINLCEEFSYSPEVEFTALDTFDRYWAGYSHGIIASHAVVVKQEESFLATQLWSQQIIKIQQDVMLKVLTVLRISAKFIRNGYREREHTHQFKTIADLLKHLKLQEPSICEMKSSEAEVTLALGHMRSSIVYAAIQTFILVGREQLRIEKIDVEDLGRLTEMILRVVYAERKEMEIKAIEKQCVENGEKVRAINSSVLSGVGCNLLAASVVLCGLVRVRLPLEFCKNYGEIIAKKIESVERLEIQKAMVLTEIINEVMGTDDK